MKGIQQGRQELLTWINEFTDCDYPKIEMLGDGVAYCQVIDAIHPGQVNLSRLNFNAKYPEDFVRNLKVLDDTFTKLHIEKVIAIDKMSKQKFQENMAFLQWLMNYVQKIGPFSMKSYRGYQKRLEVYEKQLNGRSGQMSAHLIPNTEFLRFKQNQYINNNSNNIQLQQQQQQQQDDYDQINQINLMGNQLNQKLQYLDDVQILLENDVKNHMESNWKLIYSIDDMVYQRDVLFRILSQIESRVVQFKQKSQYGDQILQIIKQVPEDFKK